MDRLNNKYSCEGKEKISSKKSVVYSVPMLYI